MEQSTIIQQGNTNILTRTISVYLCRDRLLNPVETALKDILGPGMYPFRETGGGIDIAEEQCLYFFKRQLLTQRFLGAKIIIALAHTSCHHCRENKIVPEGLTPQEELDFLEQMMRQATSNIKKCQPDMQVITGVVETRYVHPNMSIADMSHAIHFTTPVDDSPLDFERRKLRRTECPHEFQDALIQIAI